MKVKYSYKTMIPLGKKIYSDLFVVYYLLGRIVRSYYVSGSEKKNIYYCPILSILTAQVDSVSIQGSLVQLIIVYFLE